ncbi:GNAT family N-acetyltransferase [Sorangium sp. So ce1128]
MLVRLHAERWSAEGRAGVFASRRFREFHDEVMPAMFERGALDLAWLSARGEPVAALYNLVWNNKLYFYQCGRRVDLPKGLRPGTVIHAHAIRAAIAEGRREYDFLDSPCQYKLALSLSARPLVELRAARPSVNDSARRAAELAAHELRVLKRRVLATWRAAAGSLARDPAGGQAPPRRETAGGPGHRGRASSGSNSAADGGAEELATSLDGVAP